MIMISTTHLLGFLALASAGVGALVLAVATWRVTVKLDEAYDDGYADGASTVPPPGPRHAKPGLTPWPPETLALTAGTPDRPEAAAAPLSGSRDVDEWIISMRRDVDAWLASLLTDSRETNQGLQRAEVGG